MKKFHVKIDFLKEVCFFNKKKHENSQENVFAKTIAINQVKINPCLLSYEIHHSTFYLAEGQTVLNIVNVIGGESLIRITHKDEIFQFFLRFVFIGNYEAKLRELI